MFKPEVTKKFVQPKIVASEVRNKTWALTPSIGSQFNPKVRYLNWPKIELAWSGNMIFKKITIFYISPVWKLKFLFQVHRAIFPQAQLHRAGVRSTAGKRIPDDRQLRFRYGGLVHGRPQARSRSGGEPMEPLQRVCLCSWLNHTLEISIREEKLYHRWIPKWMNRFHKVSKMTSRFGPFSYQVDFDARSTQEDVHISIIRLPSY